MKILLKYLISNIKNNLLRSFLIVFSILLASSIFYVNINIYDDVIDNANSLIEGTTKGYDLLITDYDSSVVLPECEDVLNIQREEGKYKVTEEIALPISCNIVNIEELVGSNLISLSDSKIYDYSINDAIISKAKAKYYNINIGDEFTVLINDTETKVIIKDIIDSFGIFTESNLDKIELFINRKVINDNAKILKLKDDLKIESYYNSLKDINVNVEYLSKQGSGQNDANNIKKVMYVVLIFVMILSFYVISTTTKLLINYRLQVLGTFRSVGASKRQIRILLILENLIYGLVGALLGIICGDVIRRFIRSSIFDLPYIQIDYKKALYVLVFSILFDLLITIVSIFKASRKSIINLIFVKQSSYYKYPIVLGILGLLIFLSSFYISYINIELNFNYLVIELLTAIIGMSLMCGLICRIIGSLLSFITKKVNGEMWLGIKNQANSSINIGNTILLTIIVSLMLTVYVGVNSISKFIDNYSNSYSYDILIKGAEKEYSYYSFLKDVDGVDSITIEFWKNTGIKANDKEISICFVSNNGNANGIETKGYELSDLNSNEIIIDQMLANKNGFKIGDTITFKGNYYYKAKIVGYCDSAIFNSSRKAVVMSQKDYEKYIKRSPAIIGINVNKNVGSVLNNIYDSTYEKGEIDLNIYTKEQYVDKSILLASKAIGIIQAVPILVLILAFLGISNNQIVSFIQKKHIYAVLYSTSMSKSQIRKTIIHEIVTSSIIGAILGSILARWLIKIMNDIIYVTLAYIKVSIDIKYIVIFVVVFVVLMVVSTVFPIKQLNNMEIVKETSYE